MSTATKVPETWELTGDDARKTLGRVGRWRLARDAFMRFRRADGSSHARSLSYMVSLVILEGIIGLVGFAAVLGSPRLGNVVSEMIRDAVPGPAGRTLTQAVGQAEHAANGGEWVGLAFGLVGALVGGTLLMAQFERACNRLYGVETDRPTAEKYTRAFVLATTAGLAIAAAFVLLTFGHALMESADDGTARDAWSLLRWPVALGLIVAAMALLFRWAPRRRQPAWSWLAYGATISVLGVALASIGLGLFFRWSSSFGDTYGPLAGTVALLLWAGFTSVAVVYGAAVAAELEAARAAIPREHPTEDVAPTRRPAPELHR
jgi:YihY family inner membrane protein